MIELAKTGIIDEKGGEDGITKEEDPLLVLHPNFNLDDWRDISIDEIPDVKVNYHFYNKNLIAEFVDWLICTREILLSWKYDLGYIWMTENI